MPHTLVIETAALPATPTATLVIYASEDEAPAGAGAAVWADGLDWGSACQRRRLYRPAGSGARRAGTGRRRGEAPLVLGAPGG